MAGDVVKDITHDEAMASVFKEDPEYATQFFNELLKIGTEQEIVLAIRQLKLSGLEIFLTNDVNTKINKISL